MSDPNMITSYSWAAGLFQRDVPSSLIDVQKRAKLVNEINEPLITSQSGLSWSHLSHFSLYNALMLFFIQ
jgi:hypothetical protein